MVGSGGPAAGAVPTRGERIATTLAELFVVPVRCSPHGDRWAAARAALAVPWQLAGGVSRCTAWMEGEEVDVLCVGRALRLRSLLRRLLGVVGMPERLGWRVLAQVVVGRGPAHELIAAEIPPWAAPRLRSAGWIIVPESVRWFGEVSALPPKRPSDSLRSDLRKLRKRQYSLDVGTSPEDWREFFERMVLPHAHARFGREAWIPTPRLRRELAGRGTLLFLTENGERVAGLCAVGIGRMLWFPLLGIRDGDAELLRAGASAGLNALSIEWARARGFVRLDRGQSSPFVRDGLHAYKRNWGLTPAPDPLTSLVALRLDPGRPALARAFAREPVLVQGPSGLELFEG